MKKKLLVLLTVCTLAFAMCACNSSDAQKEEGSSTEQSAENESTEDSQEAENASEAENTSEADDAGKELVFDVPEGFTETEENYFTADNQEHGSNINMDSLPNDGSFESVSADLLMGPVESELESAFGTDLTLSLLEETFYETEGGNRVFRYGFEYEVQGIKIKQMQCIVEASDAYYFVTFTETEEGEYFDAFLDASKTFRFE